MRSDRLLGPLHAFFAQKKSRGCFVSFSTTRIYFYKGRYMPHLVLSFRALSVLDTARYLFNEYGFHTVGVNLIIESAKIPKATFYNYFKSKERLVEMCLSFQREALKEEVRSLIRTHKDFTVHEKLKRIFFLHADVEGFYHLPFKAIFEIEKRYPNAYQIVVGYRNWLIHEIYQLLLTSNVNASKQDAQMFLFVIDGAMVQLLGGGEVDKERLVERLGKWL